MHTLEVADCKCQCKAPVLQSSNAKRLRLAVHVCFPKHSVCSIDAPKIECHIRPISVFSMALIVNVNAKHKCFETRSSCVSGCLWLQKQPPIKHPCTINQMSCELGVHTLEIADCKCQSKAHVLQSSNAKRFRLAVHICFPKHSVYSPDAPKIECHIRPVFVLSKPLIVNVKCFKARTLSTSGWQCTYAFQSTPCVV